MTRPVTEERLDCDVAVVGAGLSGLVAARRLVRSGVTVVVLEARNRPGGRILDTQAGAPLGASLAHPTNRRLLALLKEEGLGAVPVAGRASAPAVWPGEVRAALRALDAMAGETDPAAPWRAANAPVRDQASLGSWLTDQVAGGHAATFREIVEAVWGAPAAELSLLQALAEIASAGSTGPLLDLARGRGLAVPGGLGRLTERLAAGLSDRLRYGRAVRRIRHRAGAALVEADGVEVNARRVIVAVPPAVETHVVLDPPLPGRHLIASRLPMGSAVSLAWRYDVAIDSSKLPATVALPSGGRLHGVTALAAGGGSVVTARLSGSDARTWGSRPERGQEAAAALTEWLGSARAPVAVEEHDWSGDPWSLGGWSAVAPPGALTSFGQALRESAGMLHWAGAETAIAWTGRLEGAVESGERAAAQVLSALGPVQAPPALRRS